MGSLRFSAHPWQQNVEGPFSSTESVGSPPAGSHVPGW
jgi:hypothetical protein